MPDDDARREVRVLRLLLDINNRLRLETLAALSRVFREHGVALSDNLFANLTFALPGELPGTSLVSSGNTQDSAEQPPSTDTSVTRPRSSTNATRQPISTGATPQPPSTNATPQPPSTNATPQPPSTNATPQPPSTNATPQPPSTNATPQPPSSGAAPQPPSSAGGQLQAQSPTGEKLDLKMPLGWEKKPGPAGT